MWKCDSLLMSIASLLPASAVSPALCHPCPAQSFSQAGKGLPVLGKLFQHYSWRQGEATELFSATFAISLPSGKFERPHCCLGCWCVVPLFWQADVMEGVAPPHWVLGEKASSLPTGQPQILLSPHPTGGCATPWLIVPIVLCPWPR